MKNVHLIAIFINMRNLRYNVKLEAVLVYSACFVIKKAEQPIDIFRQQGINIWNISGNRLAFLRVTCRLFLCQGWSTKRL